MTKLLRQQLNVAAVEGDADECQRLLDAGADADRDADENTGPPLAFAAWEGHLEVCRLLLDHGVSADQDDSTALLMALEARQVEVSRLLLDHGAHPLDLPETDRLQALTALPVQAIDVAKALFPNRDVEWLITNAAEIGNQAIADTLTAQRARERASPRLRGRDRMRS